MLASDRILPCPLLLFFFHVNELVLQMPREVSPRCCLEVECEFQDGRDIGFSPFYLQHLSQCLVQSRMDEYNRGQMFKSISKFSTVSKTVESYTHLERKKRLLHSLRRVWKNLT